jgi:hypothetical protein
MYDLKHRQASALSDIKDERAVRVFCIGDSMVSSVIWI